MKLRIFLMSLGAIIAFSTIAAAELPKHDALGRFVAADYEYRQGNYTAAIMKYEEIVAGGWQSGNVFYNLGNSYYKEGKLGKALLNYSRAKEFMPRDSDLRFNERYVRAFVKQTEGDAQPSLVRSFFEKYFDPFSLAEIVKALIILGILLGGFYLAAIYFSWPQQTRRNTLMAFIVLIVVGVLGLSVKLQAAQDAAIVVSDIDAKFEPRHEATVHFKLFDGTPVKLIRAEGGWVKVKRLDGKLGWCPKDSIERIALTPAS